MCRSKVAIKRSRASAMSALRTANASPWNKHVHHRRRTPAVVICSTPRLYLRPSAQRVAEPDPGVPDFPGASSVCYVDSYFAFPRLASWRNGSSPGCSIHPTSTRSISCSPRCPAERDPPGDLHRGQVWTVAADQVRGLVRQRERPVWRQTPGTESFFPFRRAARGVINLGTGSPVSVCRADNSVWWVGLGMAIVYRSNGYTRSVVSTRTIEAIIGPSLMSLWAAERIRIAGIGATARDDDRQPHAGL